MSAVRAAGPGEVAVQLPFNFIPRDYQVPPMSALDAGIKRVILRWHRRAGKEKTLINYTAKRMQDRVGAYFYFFPTYAQAKKAIWDGKDADGFPFVNHFPDILVKSRNSTELKIEYLNGSIFQLIGTDNINLIMSTNPIGCVFAEFALQDPAAWEFIRPILLENGGWAAFDFTPRGKNHAFTLHQMAIGNDAWFVSTLTVRDTKRPDGTPVISEEAIESERREGVTEEMIQQEYYVSFEGVMEGAYYGKQLAAAENEGRIGNVPYDASIGVETWWDIGVGDSNAIWFTQSIAREIHVIDYLEASGELLSYYVKELQKKPYVYTAHHGPHDLEAREYAQGGQEGEPKTRRETAKSLGIDFRIVPNIAVDDGIDAARAIMGRCWFDRTKCARGLSALASYHKEWDPKAKMFRSYPEHNWASHGADGYRYFAVGHRTTTAKLPKKQGAGERSGTTFMAN
jgi:phage terminase large subunit